MAVGRHNWIHIGSEQAGPRVAAILSVIESCRRLKIPVRNYLAHILPGLANAPVQRIADIHPCRLDRKNIRKCQQHAFGLTLTRERPRHETKN